MNSFTLADDAIARFNTDPSAAQQPWYIGSIASVQKRLRRADHPYHFRRDSRRNERITLLDTFDWQLLQRGWAAIAVERTDAAVPAITEFEVPVRKMSLNSAIPEGRFDDLKKPPNATLHAAETTIPRSDLSGRALLDLGGTESVVTQWRIVNESEKTIAVALELTLSGSRRFLRFIPLRGYAPRITGVVGAASLTETADPIDIVDVLASQRGRHPFDYDTRLRLPIAGSDDPPSAHRHIVPVLCRTMAANTRGIAEQIDIEFLHDYRVALRRLRSYLREINVVPGMGVSNTGGAKDSMLASVDTVWNASGEARDLDVFLERRSRYRSIVPESLASEVDSVFDRIERARDESYRRFLAILPTRFEERLEKELLDRSVLASIGTSSPVNATSLDTTTDLTLTDTATKWVTRRERQFLKRVRRLQDAYLQHGSAIDDEWIHDARKSAKKFRYLQEIFLPVIADDSSAHKRVKRLRKLQNLLGDYNDLVVEEHRFHQLLTSKGAKSFEDVRGAVAYMLATVEQEKIQAREQVLAELKKETS